MLTTPHTLVGVVIAFLAPNPFLVFPLTLISHFILDFLIPHWNPHLYTEFHTQGKVSKNSFLMALIDGLTAAFIVLWLVLKNLGNYPRVFLIFVGVFGATLPDLVEIPYYFFGCKNKLLKKYVDFEHKYQSNGVFWLGVLTQVIVIIVSLKFLIFSARG